MTQTTYRGWSKPISQRAGILFILTMVLLILGFYTVTDASRLQGDHVLEGADYAGYAVCHRITDRSFTIAGRQMPLCARCTGMYLGVMLTFIVLGMAGRRRWSMLPPLKVMLILLAMVFLMGIDGINSYTHFFPNFPHVYEPKNWLRLITGIGAGLTMGIVLFPALSQTLWRDQEQRPVIGNLREVTGMVMLALLVVVLVLSNQSTILYILGLTSAAGVVLVLTSINAAALLILSKKDAKATNWGQAIIPLTIGLVLALSQLALISFVRFSVTGTMSGLPGI